MGGGGGSGGKTATCRRRLLLCLSSLVFAYLLVVALMNTQPFQPVEPSWEMVGRDSDLDIKSEDEVALRSSRFGDKMIGASMQKQSTRTDEASQRRLFFSGENKPSGKRQVSEVSEHKHIDDISKNRSVDGRDTPNLFHFDESAMLIPRVIHQTWEDLVVPGQNADWILTWKKNHPDWDYWFWTEHGASQMIQKDFPESYGMYLDYPYTINRADVRRYFIMYRYGGVYADLDVESLRPLHDLINKYTCIIAQEPREHQVLLYHNKHPNYVMPAFIACRPRHPFFKLVLEMLPRYASKARDLPWNDNIFLSTGPMFLAEVLERYLRERNRTADEYIHLAPSEMFMPTYDSMNDLTFRFQCTHNVSTLTSAEKIICDSLVARDFANKPRVESYATHHWVHSWSNNFLAHGHISLKDVFKGLNFTVPGNE